ncbi:MAG: CDP-diacylglycerol--glycerol-3-phosphate 3-phosphatidyltransferase, partial [Leptospiraceae bacterium]|nr:CDP-diacylglycerol--glycerol-3-phosphate 3-phosphatidyltransferase [Leptospiraceae bacterium]
MKLEWNLPNILTMLRVVSVPFFIYLLLQSDPLSRWIAFGLFALASLTDLVDGYLARKYRLETELGKFLDPLADKLLVLGSFITFLALSSQVQLWMVLCIIGRDFLITSMRFLAVRKGASLRTSMFGKVKTVFQMLAIILIIFSFLIISWKERGQINAMFEGQSLEFGRSVFMIAWHNLTATWQGAMPGSIWFQLSSFGP